MRIHANFSSFLSPTPNQSSVVQVEKSPQMGEEGQAPINGKFLLPVPLDSDFPVLGVRNGTFTSVDAGDDPATQSEFNTATPHGLKEGDVVTISGTLNYDGVYPVTEVREKMFLILVPFVVTEAGSWDKGDYLLNSSGFVDGYDLASQGMARLLAAYPMFGNVYFNPLLTADHVGELDFNFSFKDPSTGEFFKPRFQTGRESGVDDAGQYPTHTALLAQNEGTLIPRPGLLVTEEIDISAYTLDCDGKSVGTDEFMLWWKLYHFEITHDIASDFGATQGTNSPAIRYVEEMDQEPSGFSAYISIDGGANWCEVGLLEPVSFCEKTKKVLIAFKNTGNVKRYIASFALLF